MSKLQLKIVANSLSLIAAIMFVAAVFAVYIQPQVVNRLGSYAILVYELSYFSEAEKSLAQLAQGKTGNVVKLLESQKWKNRNGGWRLNSLVSASNLPVDGDQSAWIAAGCLKVAKGDQFRNRWTPGHT